MIAATTLVFDTTGLRPIQPSGFVPPSQRAGYSDPLVQDFLQEAFGGQFPKLESFKENAAVYRHEDPTAGSLIDCVAAQSLKELPQAEIMRLLQGWITLRRTVMETAAPEGVRSLLMNLRIPDPRKALQFYRISHPKSDDPKLYVLIGFEGETAPSVSLEEGIAAMLNVKPSQLESLLATSMTATPAPPRVSSLAPATVETPAPRPKASSGVKNAALLCASAALLISAVGVVWKMNHHPAPAPVVAAPPPPAPSLPTPEPTPAPALPVAQAAAPVAPPSVPAKPLPAPPPLPSLDAMSTGAPSDGATMPTTPPADLTNLMAQ